MGRPLDRESKAFGIFKITDLYVIIFVFLIGLMFTPILMRLFGLPIALGIFGFFLFFITAYFVIANSFPDRLVLNWIHFHFEPRHYLPRNNKVQGGRRDA